MHKLLILCLLTLSLISFPKIPHSEEGTTIYQPDHIAKFRIEKDEGIINLQGEINDDSEKQTQAAFAYFNENHIRNVIIHLHSLGGSVKSGYDIITIMTYAEKHNINVITLVDHKEYCASMCTAIFAAGINRIAARDTVWIFHSPYIKLSDGELRDPIQVVEAQLAIKLARKLMLRVYYSADPTFTKTVLEPVINDNSDKPLILYGYELIDHTESFVSMNVAD